MDTFKALTLDPRWHAKLYTYRSAFTHWKVVQPAPSGGHPHRPGFECKTLTWKHGVNSSGSIKNWDDSSSLSKGWVFKTNGDYLHNIPSCRVSNVEVFVQHHMPYWVGHWKQPFSHLAPPGFLPSNILILFDIVRGKKEPPNSSHQGQFELFDHGNWTCCRFLLSSHSFLQTLAPELNPADETNLVSYWLRESEWSDVTSSKLRLSVSSLGGVTLSGTSWRKLMCGHHHEIAVA